MRTYPSPRSLGGPLLRVGARALLILVVLFGLADCASWRAALKGDDACRDRMNNCLEGCDPLMSGAAHGGQPVYGYQEGAGACQPSPYSICAQRCYDICG